MSTPDKPRAADELRPLRLERPFASNAAGSVMIHAGQTMVLCTASVAADVPPWLAGRGKGWVTAEYNMLPGSTSPRKPRDRQKVDGRTTEIQRLIGRSLRAVVDLGALGERSITVDCDVIRADGGTRTASITGAFVALVDAVRSIEVDPPELSKVFRASVAAVSVGIVDGAVQLDLNYEQDYAAAVDMNVVMTGRGRFVEVQGTGEEATFSAAELQQLIAAASLGTTRLTELQREALGPAWPCQ
ncbi:ribonuclease PH [Posidoniimonas polymericola]|nr:ribonuclease PH [Posidoniimonas polymericola]